MGVMQLTFFTDLLVVFSLVAGIAITSPIPFGTYDRRREETPSPHIFCITWNGRRLCERFELPVDRRHPESLSLPNAYLSTVTGSGSDEDRQIRRIMDVEGDAKVIESEQAWLVPDVQVVLCFVLLCCLIEGIVSGLKW